MSTQLGLAGQCECPQIPCAAYGSALPVQGAALVAHLLVAVKIMDRTLSSSLVFEEIGVSCKIMMVKRV